MLSALDYGKGIPLILLGAKRWTIDDGPVICTIYRSAQAMLGRRQCPANIRGGRYYGTSYQVRGSPILVVDKR